MKTKIYSVYDHKAGAFLQPFYMPNDGLAIRALQDCAYDQDHQFFRHPEDFTLFEVGEFDNQDCSFDLLPSPSPIKKVIEVHPSSNPNSQQELEVQQDG
jgi:hypothetical protein